MRRAIIIVGANYGDEGKGMAAAAACPEDGECLNILINGGPQRGHTVDLPGGKRHIFHHFGSASLKGAVSYADEDYMVNPLLFAREYEELGAEFRVQPRLLVHAACRTTTPWDMMLGRKTGGVSVTAPAAAASMRPGCALNKGTGACAGGRSLP